MQRGGHERPAGSALGGGICCSALQPMLPAHEDPSVQ